MRFATVRKTPLRRSAPAIAALCVVVAGAGLTACSSTKAAPTAPASAAKTAIPSSAFSDRTGITPTSVTVATIAWQQIFKSATGVQAYFDYVNSTGGVNGRKLYVVSSDDSDSGATNKQLTQAAIGTDFATVGSFSLQDGFGGTVFSANPGVPNVSPTLDPTATQLPNSFSAAVSAGGWQLGPLAYFKAKFPSTVTHAGALVANIEPAPTLFGGEKAAMDHLGYNLVYDQTFDVTQQDFNQNVITMRNDGVKILFIEQMPQNYAGAVLKALNQQNFHPVVVLGASTYSEQLVPSSGGAPNIDGSYLEQNAALYLGEDAAGLAAVNTFLTWIQKAQPGFHADLYSFYGWINAELFVQALRQAGTNPSRGSVLQALRNITSFSAGSLVGTSNPAKKIPSNCYLIATFKNGQIQRLDDPPVGGPTHGYRCDLPYYYKPA
jgi:ABC-type branched-subunit amino acid transport system substrate-binding protein